MRFILKISSFHTIRQYLRLLSAFWCIRWVFGIQSACAYYSLFLQFPFIQSGIVHISMIVFIRLFVFTCIQYISVCILLIMTCNVYRYLYVAYYLKLRKSTNRYTYTQLIADLLIKMWVVCAKNCIYSLLLICYLHNFFICS